MSTANLTAEQLAAILKADNALSMVEIFGPLAAKGHTVDLHTLTQMCANARSELRDAIYAPPRPCDRIPIRDTDALYGLEESNGSD